MASKSFNSVLVKVASICNLKCTYCYWFRDPSVYEKPKVMAVTVEDQLVIRIQEHVLAFQLPEFNVILHGGEPLLFGKKRFEALCRKLQAVEAATGTKIGVRLVSNGLLIDQEWVDLFNAYRCSVTLSIDSTPSSHDRHRIDFRGQGSYEKVKAALRLMQKNGIQPGTLCVCDPAESPADVCRHIVEDLQVSKFDILIPDENHDSKAVRSISGFYRQLFDLWYEKYSHKGVEIRLLNDFTANLLGMKTTESLGYGPLTTLTILTDGSLEALDVLRISGNGFTKSKMNIHFHALDEARRDPVWAAAHAASLKQPKECLACPYRVACGSGYLPHRFSREKQFDNPSVYCRDLKEIFGHVEGRIYGDLKVRVGG